MQNLRNKLIVGGAVLILALIGSVMNSRQSTIQGASGPSVTIDPTQLPLPVTGTVAVTGNVAATGTVAATQSGAWSVGISGTPTVNVTGPVTATQSGTWNVGITNTPTVNLGNAVLPTQNVGGGAATQVGQLASKLVNLICPANSACFQILPNGFQFSTAYTVPNGEALVITDVQYSGNGIGGQYNITHLQSNNFTVATFGALADSSGFSFASIRLGTGIVITPGNPISILGAGGMQIQGYLVQNL